MSVPLAQVVPASVEGLRSSKAGVAASQSIRASGRSRGTEGGFKAAAEGAAAGEESTFRSHLEEAIASPEVRQSFRDSGRSDPGASTATETPEDGVALPLPEEPPQAAPQLAHGDAAQPQPGNQEGNEPAPPQEAVTAESRLGPLSELTIASLMALAQPDAPAATPAEPVRQVAPVAEAMVSADKAPPATGVSSQESGLEVNPPAAVVEGEDTEPAPGEPVENLSKTPVGSRLTEPFIPARDEASPEVDARPQGNAGKSSAPESQEAELSQRSQQTRNSAVIAASDPAVSDRQARLTQDFTTDAPLLKTAPKQAHPIEELAAMPKEAVDNNPHQLGKNNLLTSSFQVGYLYRQGPDSVAGQDTIAPTATPHQRLGSPSNVDGESSEVPQQLSRVRADVQTPETALKEGDQSSRPSDILVRPAGREGRGASELPYEVFRVALRTRPTAQTNPDSFRSSAGQAQARLFSTGNPQPGKTAQPNEAPSRALDTQSLPGRPSEAIPRAAGSDEPALEASRHAPKSTLLNTKPAELATGKTFDGTPVANGDPRPEAQVLRNPPGVPGQGARVAHSSEPDVQSGGIPPESTLHTNSAVASIRTQPVDAPPLRASGPVDNPGEHPGQASTAERVQSVERLVDLASLQKKHDSHRMELLLSNQRTGRVSLRLTERAGLVDAMLRTDSTRGRDIITESLPALQEALSRRGLQTSFSGSGSTGSDRGHGFEQPGGRSRHPRQGPRQGRRLASQGAVFRLALE